MMHQGLQLQQLASATKGYKGSGIIVISYNNNDNNNNSSHVRGNSRYRLLNADYEPGTMISMLKP
jgi:hypothetical protein